MSVFPPFHESPFFLLCPFFPQLRLHSPFLLDNLFLSYVSNSSPYATSLSTSPLLHNNLGLSPSPMPPGKVNLFFPCSRAPAFPPPPRYQFFETYYTFFPPYLLPRPYYLFNRASSLFRNSRSLWTTLSSRSFFISHLLRFIDGRLLFPPDPIFLLCQSHFLFALSWASQDTPADPLSFL